MTVDRQKYSETAWGARGRQFKSARPDQSNQSGKRRRLEFSQRRNAIDAKTEQRGEEL